MNHALENTADAQAHAEQLETEGTTSQLGQRAHQASERVTGSLHSAVERIQYEADESPLFASLTSLVVGFGLGVLATSVYYNSRPEPSAWEQIKSARWWGN